MQKPFWEPNKYDFGTCNQSLENTCKIYSEQLNQVSTIEKIYGFFKDCCKLKAIQYKFNHNEELICLVANYLYSLEIVDEALEFLLQELELF